MEIEAKQRNQRNRRRERAQRMLAQRESLASAKQQQQQQQQRQRPDEEDSGEDEDPGGLGLGLSRGSHPRDNHQRPPRPPRPPRPRKKSSLQGASQKEPPFEEDIIDGFAILAFRTYEELEVSALRPQSSSSSSCLSFFFLSDLPSFLSFLFTSRLRLLRHPTEPNPFGFLLISFREWGNFPTERISDQKERFAYRAPRFYTFRVRGSHGSKSQPLFWNWY